MTQPNLLKRLGLDKDSQGGLAKYYVLETLLTYYDTTYSIGENPKAVSNPDGTAYYLDQSLGHAVTLHDPCGGGGGSTGGATSPDPCAVFPLPIPHTFCT